MKLAIAVSFFVLAIALSHSYEEANAELVANQPYLMEGTGFAVTEESIKNSQIDLLIATERQIGSRTPILVEDGFVTLNEMDFVATDLTGTVLRDGRFLRIVGTVEDPIGNELSISIFGRLIQHSDEGSVYGFTGRLTQGTETSKIIYTTKISGLTSTIPGTTTPTPAPTGVEEEIIIHIRKGAADISQFSYIDVGQPDVRGPYTQDRITIEPGTTITWINDDVASHSISSGTGLGSHNRASQGAVKICDESQLQTFESDPGHGSSGFSFKSPIDPVTRVGTGCTFTMDGRIKSGEILPGESWSVTIEEPGFYRLADVDYIWMTSVVYAFPDVGSKTLPSTEAHPLN